MTVEYSDDAKKQLKKMDRYIAKQIMEYIDEIQAPDNPRLRGHELKGNLRTLWRYRNNDWRIVCEIQDDKMILYVLVIDHRKSVYQ